MEDKALRKILRILNQPKKPKELTLEAFVDEVVSEETSRNYNEVYNGTYAPAFKMAGIHDDLVAEELRKYGAFRIDSFAATAETTFEYITSNNEIVISTVLYELPPNLPRAEKLVREFLKSDRHFKVKTSLLPTGLFTTVEFEDATKKEECVESIPFWRNCLQIGIMKDLREKLELQPFASPCNTVTVQRDLALLFILFVEQNRL